MCSGCEQTLCSIVVSVRCSHFCFLQTEKHVVQLGVAGGHTWTVIASKSSACWLTAKLFPGSTTSQDRKGATQGQRVISLNLKLISFMKHFLQPQCYRWYRTCFFMSTLFVVCLLFRRQSLQQETGSRALRKSVVGVIKHRRAINWWLPLPTLRHPAAMALYKGSQHTNERVAEISAHNRCQWVGTSSHNAPRSLIIANFTELFSHYGIRGCPRSAGWRKNM